MNVSFYQRSLIFCRNGGIWGSLVTSVAFVIVNKAKSSNLLKHRVVFSQIQSEICCELFAAEFYFEGSESHARINDLFATSFPCLQYFQRLDNYHHLYTNWATIYPAVFLHFSSLPNCCRILSFRFARFDVCCDL